MYLSVLVLSFFFLQFGYPTHILIRYSLSFLTHDPSFHRYYILYSVVDALLYSVIPIPCNCIMT